MMRKLMPHRVRYDAPHMLTVFGWRRVESTRLIRHFERWQHINRYRVRQGASDSVQITALRERHTFVETKQCLLIVKTLQTSVLIGWYEINQKCDVLYFITHPLWQFLKTFSNQFFEFPFLHTSRAASAYQL